MKSLKLFSPFLLRIGISLVFLWFGVSQISDPSQWVGFVPDSIVSLSGLSVTTLVYLNGIFEIVMGSALILGFFSRLSALLLTLHMLDITYIVGMNAIGVRDFGLSVAILCVFLNGADGLTLDRYIKKDVYASSRTV